MSALIDFLEKQHTMIKGVAEDIRAKYPKLGTLQFPPTITTKDPDVQQLFDYVYKSDTSYTPLEVAVAANLAALGLLRIIYDIPQQASSQKTDESGDAYSDGVTLFTNINQDKFFNRVETIMKKKMDAIRQRYGKDSGPDAGHGNGPS